MRLLFFYSLICLCFHNHIWAQRPLPHNLVFEGAGIRGMAFTGALQTLDSAGMLKSLVRVAGTSSGSMQATMLAVGYSPKEITQVMDNTSMGSFTDGGLIFFGGSLRTLFQFGWFRGNAMENFIESKLEEKTGNGNLTFSQLHDLALKDKRFLDLFITATNLTMQRLEVFSFQSYPNMRIADAVRASTCIPLYYRPVWIDSVGKAFTRVKRAPPNAMCLVDGGMAANFPIGLFDSTVYGSSSVRMKGKGISYTVLQPNPLTLGLRVDRHEESLIRQGQPQVLPITKLSQFTGAMYVFMLDRLNTMAADSTDDNRTVFIDVGDAPANIKKIKPEVSAAMVEAGRVGVREYLKEEKKLF